MWVSPPVFTPEDRSWVAGGLRAQGPSEPTLPGDGTRGLPPLQPLLRGGEEGHVGKREQFIRESQFCIAPAYVALLARGFEGAPGLEPLVSSQAKVPGIQLLSCARGWAQRAPGTASARHGA